jgi:proteasome accessory factor C
VIEYRAAADDAVAKRTVEPRILLHRDGRWYLAAWNVAKGEEHLFRLDRIVSVEPGTRVFGEHKGPSVSRYARKTLYFESGAEREVTIRFRGTSARIARHRYGSRARENGDGTVSVATKVTPGRHLFGVVLGYGGDAAVESPPDVATAFTEYVAELARTYAEARVSAEGS